MSLGGEFSKAMNDAAANVVKSGIFLSAAAGNKAENASNSSPASASEVCTIAASTSSDGSASFTNFGSVVDLYAPGQGITAAYPGGGSKTLSGTSMAAPHVAGVTAYLIALEGVTANKACARLVELATSSISRAPSGTTSKLLYNDVNATALEDSGFSSLLKEASFVKTIGMILALDILLFAQILQMEVSIGSQYSSMMTLNVLNGEVTYAKLTASNDGKWTAKNGRSGGRFWPPICQPFFHSPQHLHPRTFTGTSAAPWLAPSIHSIAALSLTLPLRSKSPSPQGYRKWVP
ncbi:hypothetical protein PENANT_c119G03504 [Penicillium antarcticum]|uniref:Peptidase S8/S53 domain-containing protein n=1 Tax=Penicillium antarcticum TaxID=416450 RepID=A0A1V6PIC0_9EURO|nr:hypothetical protein PENANT_c119G03504 [Penicillium antarcticum]